MFKVDYYNDYLLERNPICHVGSVISDYYEDVAELIYKFLKDLGRSDICLLVSIDESDSTIHYFDILGSDEYFIAKELLS